MRKIFLIGLALAFFMFLLTLFRASAGGPVFWRINSRSEIEKGDSQAISIDDNGRMTLAPALIEVFDTKQAYIWSAVADNTGNVYLGTGHEGRIFKVDSSGKGTLFFKAPELDVMALAVDIQGNVYAGTAPDGKVYRISPSGEAKLFFDPKTKYIWSLAFDQTGRLYVGTGDKGVIFRVNPDGKGSPFVNTSQTNITALVVDRAGNLIAGTDPGGLILKLSPDGKVFTLFDTQQREIRELGLGKNEEILALALAEVAGAGGVGASTPMPLPTVSGGDEGGVTITISDVQPVDASAGAGTAPVIASAGGQSKAALYRIDPNGGSDLLWDSKEATAFAISLEDEAKRIMIGSGNKGRIYSVVAGQKSRLLAQTPQAQISRFIRAGNQTYAATSNLGKLYKLSSEPAIAGAYTSSIRDAQGVASWGRISWSGEGTVAMQTRSGNTSPPDSTWSDWSAPVSMSDGEAIKSPPARFIQWRATLKKSPGGVLPTIREVVLSYLPRNIAPQISSLTILPPGTSLQALPQPPIEGAGDPSSLETSGASASMPIIPPRRLFQKGAISLQWQAEDRNGDAIEYAVYFRDANKSDAFPLKSGLRDTYFTVEPNSLPDGRYVFKIVATDALSNPGSLALNDEQETEAVEIDNTPPVLTIETPRIMGASAEIVFRAVDGTSIIRRGEYQIDGGTWKALFPTDGIADSKREEFRITIPLSDSGPHMIAVRAFDANANVSSTQAALRSR